MNRKTLTSMLSALCLAPVVAVAVEVSVPQCPQKLPIQQEIREQQADGWKIANNTSTRWLKGIAISAWEYPVVQGLMIPTDEKLPKGDIIGHYETSPDTSGEHDFWVICHYMDSAAVLVQRLPENVRRCEVLYRNDVTVPDRVIIKCFDTPRAKK
ncbi:MAG: hypothetical protein LBP99_02260 [Azoarcus sp.]|jgi:hypothetical protein|nr:hypothetical protein [Azoarcus sp.]